MSYKKQELLTFREHLSSPPFFLVGSVLLIFLVFCVILLCVFMFRVPRFDVLCVFSIKNYVRFLLTSSCLLEGSYLVCWRDHILFVRGIISCLLVISCLCYLCLFVCRGVQHILCLLLFCYSSHRVPYVVSLSRLSIFDCPFSIL